jgi:crotonobetainyl-CoA:carnitine CoA-transferase CaiB-like acyl-CoA transferase
VLEQPDLGGDARFETNVARVANRSALDVVIRAVFGSLTREQAVQRLRRARIAYGSVNGVDNLSRHPALRRMETATPVGAISTIAPAVRQGGEEVLTRAVPSLNQQGDALRREFAQ